MPSSRSPEKRQLSTNWGLREKFLKKIITEQKLEGLEKVNKVKKGGSFFLQEKEGIDYLDQPSAEKN